MEGIRKGWLMVVVVVVVDDGWLVGWLVITNKERGNGFVCV